MRYYPVVLIILRFMAVLLALWDLYLFARVWLSDLFDLFSSDVVSAVEAKRLLYYNHETLMTGLRGILLSAAIYFSAPFLARLIVWKSED